LTSEIMSQSHLALERVRDEAKEMVVTMVDMEASYLTAEFFREILRADTSHADQPRTLSGKKISDHSATHPSSMGAGATGDGLMADEAHLRQVASHVSAYLSVVCNQLKATIPKAIVHCLVLEAKRSLLDKFVENVAGKDSESLRRLLGESEDIMNRRDQCTKRLELLQQAYREITGVLGTR